MSPAPPIWPELAQLNRSSTNFNNCTAMKRKIFKDTPNTHWELDKVCKQHQNTFIFIHLADTV